MSDTARLQPPIATQAIDPTTQAHSPAWAEHHQKVTDRLADLQSKIDTLNTTIAALSTGVTDGSDAAAGMVGEFLSASSPGAPLTNGVPLDRVTLTLPAGDWDVAGSAIIVASLVTMSFCEAWLSTAANTPTDPGRTAIQAQTTTAGVLGAMSLVVGPVRFSVSASTAVHLGCQANFPAGTTVTAGGWLRARRVR